MKKLAAADFRRLLRVVPGEEDGIWIPWLRVAEDGVYFKCPEDAPTPLLSANELLAAFDFLDLDFKSVKLNPRLLTFPCSLPQLQEFTEAHGLAGAIDAFALVAWVAGTDTDRREAPDSQRLRLMVEAATTLGLPPRRLPPRAKGKIKTWCLANHPHLFTPATFDHTWKQPERKECLDWEAPY